MGEYMWNDAQMATQMVNEDGVTMTTLDDASMDAILAAYEEAASNPDITYILDSMAEYREKIDFYRGKLGKYGLGFVKE